MTSTEPLEVPDFGGVRVGVVGDAMLDRYCFGETTRVSPEAPVPVVRVVEEEDRPGGAANVALNLATLGVDATLFAAVGDDTAGHRLRALIAGQGVADALSVCADIGTVTKLRIVSRHQQLLRVDSEQPLDAAAVQVRATLASRGAGLGALVLSDYAKGTVRDSASLVEIARTLGVPLLVDPKGADFDRYRGAFLLTPNLTEFEAVVGASDTEQELSMRAERLRAELGLRALLVTRGERGMSLFERDRAPVHVPAVAREVFDVTGAGDTVIATMAACVAAGRPLIDAVRLANAAAGVVVARLGAASVTPEELRSAVAVPVPPATGVVLLDALPAVVGAARARGERIVMTNGCFDLLHLGHVRYLEAARKLGDRLLVAVNEDASVGRLKGASRPLNGCVARMQMLAALAAVDWVVSFAEDTPRALIEAVSPDVLVKGGDYRPDDIAGAQWVREHGGEVRVLDYVDGYSTTGLMESAGAALAAGTSRSVEGSE